MVWLGGMFVGGAIGQGLSSSFYALGDTKTPTKISVCTYTLYIPIKILAFHFFSMMGLALATSIYYLTNVALQAYGLQRRKIL
jgi:putative peptidoglycan lipid II flippase